MSSHDKISLTARMVAYFRQFSDIPFAKDVAEHIGAALAFKGVVSQDDLDSREFAAYAPMFEARYKSIGSLILKSGAKQVLELASGFSLRGLAMARDPGLRYVESDLDGLTDEKSGLISKLRERHGLADHGNHRLASANALELDQLRSAVSDFDRGGGIAVVHEGLLQYFSASERATVARNIHALLEEFAHGAWITPDFALKSDAAADVSEKRQRFRQAVSGLTERQLGESAFEKKAQLEAFFEENGFLANEIQQLAEVPTLSSAETLGISAEVIGKLRALLRIWVLRLTNA